MRRVFVALTILTMVSWGCSLVVDTDGLAGDPLDASLPESGPIAPLVPEDANTGALPDAGCDATFCDNFDEEPFAAKWDSRRAGAGTTLGITSSSFSSPNALRVQFDNPKTLDDAHAVLIKSLPVPTKGFRCDLELYVLSRPTQLFGDFLRVRTKGPNVDDYWMNLGVQASGVGTMREDVYQSDGGCPCPRAQKDPPEIPTGRWVHVTFETDMKKLTSTFDGVATSIDLLGLVPTGPAILEVGLQDFTDFRADILLDDVVCRLPP